MVKPERTYKIHQNNVYMKMMVYITITDDYMQLILYIKHIFQIVTSRPNVVYENNQLP